MSSKFHRAALEVMPELKDRGVITREEILTIMKLKNVAYPQQTIANSSNSISRGVFKFSVESDTFTKTNMEQEPEKIETDEELDVRIRQTYSNLELLIQSVAVGHTKSLIASGAAGVGKSYTVTKVLDENNSDYVLIKGYVKATAIFKLLYENRFENQVIVFDDSDEVFRDEVGLNLLKGALELKKHRRISWLSEKEFITEDGETIPKSFDYSGSVIFLTNLDFDGLIAKGNKLAPHLLALESRSLYLDLGIKTRRELMTRIKQVVNESTMLAELGVSKYQESLLLNYMIKNADNLKELSLRTIQKLGALSLTSAFEWEKLADSVLLRK